MKNSKRSSLAALLSAAVISTLPACGGGGSSGGPIGGGDPQQPATPPTAAPVPDPSPTPTPPQTFGATAKSCYETTPGVVGDRVAIELEFVGPISGTQIITSKVVSKDAAFEGFTGLYQFDGTDLGSTTINGQTVLSDSTSKLYARLNPDGLQEFIGTVVKLKDTTPSGGPKRIDTIKVVGNPPIADQSPNIVEGTSITFTRNTLNTFTLADGTESPTTRLASTVTTKYVGKEVVTVPAGIYLACKFESVQSGSSDVSTSWIYRSTVIKGLATTPSGTQIVQLRSASINGVPL